MKNDERKPIKIDIKHDTELTDDELPMDTGEFTKKILEATNKLTKKLEDISQEEKDIISAIRELSEDEQRRLFEEHKEIILGNKILRFEDPKDPEFMPNIPGLKISNTRTENEYRNHLIYDLAERGLRTNIASKTDKRNGRKYNVITTTDIEENARLPKNFKYTALKRRIVNTLGTFFDNEQQAGNIGPAVIRVDHLYNKMNGFDTYRNVHHQTLLDLMDTAEQLTYVGVVIDATEHLLYNEEGKGHKRGFKKTYKGKILQADFEEEGYRDDPANWYGKIRIFHTPVFFEYALDTRQYLNYDMHTIDLTRYLNENGDTRRTKIEKVTERHRTIYHYLLERINHHKYAKKNNKKVHYFDVLFETLYQIIKDEESQTTESKETKTDKNKKGRQKEVHLTEEEKNKKLKNLEKNFKNRVNKSIKEVCEVIKLKTELEINNYEIIKKGRINYYKIRFYDN